MWKKDETQNLAEKLISSAEEAKAKEVASELRQILLGLRTVPFYGGADLFVGTSG